MADEPGLVVGGRYRLVESLGQGGMGQVWRAHDEKLDRDVAVKQMRFSSELSAQQREELVERARREAIAAARLHHPGIVTVHDVVDHDRAPWIVMEYVPGTSLGSLISREGRISWQRAAEIGVQVADALRHVHDAGVIHRDLKPDNILLAENRSVITDFGIAHINDAASRLTSTNQIIGTPHYMSPERLHGEEMTAASDMWSLGATLYAAIEGHPPFDGKTPMAIATAAATEPLPVPHNAGPLASLLAALLAKDYHQRPDAATTARQLREITTTPTAPTVSPPPPPPDTRHLTRQFVPTTSPVTQPPPQPPRSRPGLIFGVPALVVIAAGIIVVTWLLVANAHNPTNSSGPSGSSGSSGTSGPTGAQQPGTMLPHPSQADCTNIESAWDTFVTSWNQSTNSQQEFNAVNTLFSQVNSTMGAQASEPSDQKFVADLGLFGLDVSKLDEAVTLSHDASTANSTLTKLGSDFKTVLADCTG